MIELLTVQKVATLLKTSKQQVRKLIRCGAIPAMKIGREWRIPTAYLMEFLEDNLE